MKKKYCLLGLTLLLIISLISNTLAATIDDYKNGSTSSSVNSNKMITYFESKRMEATGTVFCIGKDDILYYESFFDEERDYYNLPFQQHIMPNATLSKEQKQINPINLQMMYVHNPNCYDSPANLSNLSGNKYDIGVEWEGEKEKWRLNDATNSVLFETPADDKRGEWTIYLYGTDATGKPIFDKESVGFAKFRVHKAPIPKFIFTQTSTTATLSNDGSYDLDYQYKKNSRKNLTGDREYAGIKEFYWSAKIGGTWVDVGRGPTVTFNKSGKQITDYMLTVEDYDGAFNSISKSLLILEKPLVDFDFLINKQAATYVYYGNVAHETLSVYPLITWNDEAYNKELYTTSGTQTQKWTALASTETQKDSIIFSTNVLNKKFNSIQKNKTIPVELEAKNKYDYYATKQKSIAVFYTDSKDLTGTIGTISCHYCDPVIAPKKAFEAGKDITFIFEITNPNVKVDDLNIVLAAPDIGISNLELTRDGNTSKFKADVLPDDPDHFKKAYWDQFEYTISIYSKRTNELIHRLPGKVIIHTPLSLGGSVNGQTDGEIEVSTEEITEIGATTKKYAETVTVTLPMDVIDPETGSVIRSGTKIPMVPDETHTNWTVNVIFPNVSEDTPVIAEFEAKAFNGRDKETSTIGFTVISYRLENLRITKVRDLALDRFYMDANGDYNDIEMDVNKMAIDPQSFAPYPIDVLTKGYLFEFKIDSRNFNDDADTVVITPSFYAITDNYRDPQEKSAFWVDSNKEIWSVGDSGHSAYGIITLTRENRTINDSNRATWSGKYMIPGTTFLTNPGTSVEYALENNLKADIIVNFHIVGYKNGVPKFDYNLKQWPKERSIAKVPYQIGDVIRYSGKNSNLDDLKIIRPRP